MLRRFDAVTGITILICVVWTLWAKWDNLTLSEAGAVREHLLWEGEYWRLLTSMVLHDPFGWLHLILNCVSLYFVGRVVAKVCGPRVYLACLVLAGQAGLAASFFWHADVVWRVGISGGIAGLLGLLLAVEWSVTRSVGEFLRQRNTIVIGVIAVVSTGIGVYVELTQGILVDHAAHGGGFLFGFLAGIAYYARTGTRPLAGILAAVAFGVLPIAYLCHPVGNTDYLLFKGDRAYRAEEWDTAASYYERVLGTDPGNTIAGARLASLQDDPSILDGLEPPRRDAAALALQQACLELAERRLASDPEEVRALVDRAVEVAPGSAKLWYDFATKAEKAQNPVAAYIAYKQASRWLRLRQRSSEAWLPESQALRLITKRLRPGAPPEEELPILLDAAVTAREAADGLGDSSGLDADARKKLEAAIRGVAVGVYKYAARLEPLREQLPDLPRLNGELAALFRKLANNTGREEMAPEYRFRSAVSWWRQLQRSEIDPQAFRDLAARFRAAHDEAREQGNRNIQVVAEQWFRQQGLPVPAGDLADDADGG